jgi:hypothetical protein
MHRAVLFWTKKKYLRLYEYDSRVAEACLVDGMTFDAANNRLAKEYLQLPGQHDPHRVYLDVGPVPIADHGQKLATPRTAMQFRATKRRRRP